MATLIFFKEIIYNIQYFPSVIIKHFFPFNNILLILIIIPILITISVTAVINTTTPSRVLVHI